MATEEVTFEPATTPRDGAYVFVSAEQRAALLAAIEGNPELQSIVEKLSPEAFSLGLSERWLISRAREEFAIEGELEVDDTAIISQADEGDWVSLFGWIPRPEQRNQWLTTCPECLNPLVVASAVLEAPGDQVDLGTLRCGDGFEVHHPDAQQNGSTSDEVVVCTGVHCRKVYRLADLAIEKECPPCQRCSIGS